MIGTLQQIPADIIPHDHIGIKWPASNNELPRVVISVRNINELNSGIGNFIGVHREDVEHISEIKGSKISGFFQLNILGITAENVNVITTAIINIISEKKDELEIEGFLSLSLESLGEIVPSKVGSGPFGQKNVWKRLIEYKGVYEHLYKEIFGSGEMIREIHASINELPDEKMIIKK